MSDELKLFYRLGDLADRILDKAWYRTAQWERSLIVLPEFREQAEDNLKELSRAYEMLAKALDILHENFPTATDKAAELYMELGRCTYLIAKAHHFAGRKKETEEYYQMAHKFYEKALLTYNLLNNTKGKINSIRYLAIVDDQDIKGSSIVAKRAQVIGPLNELFYELSLKHSSYDAAFETVLHVTEVMIGLIFANVGKNTPSKALPDGFKSKLVKIGKETAKVSAKLLGGYLLAWILINKILLKPLIQNLLTKAPIASLPAPLSVVIVGFFKWAFPPADLIECFETKANIHHDLMKGYEKVHDEDKAAFHRLQSQFYFNEVIEMLDPVRDSDHIKELLEYM